MNKFTAFLISTLLATNVAFAEVELVEIVDTGFTTSLTNAGDDRLFITQKPGTIEIIENGSVLPTPFLDIEDRVYLQNNDERGLLSVAFHPDYDTNAYFYVNYTVGSFFNMDTRISRFEVSENNPNLADASTESILLEIDQDFGNHNGGLLKFGPDGMLYIGMGDGGSSYDPNCRAQTTDTLLGKMLRLDVNQNVNTSPFHGIPADNPFINDGNIMNKVWATGLRNPWRFSFDRDTGDLWIGDVGQNQFEEVNFQPASSSGGENYGWKMMEGNLCVDSNNFPGDCPVSVGICNDPDLTDPVTGYSHTNGNISITGGYVYRGNLAPSLEGLYVFGDLISGNIYTYDLATDDRQLLMNHRPGVSMVTFGEDINGELYICYSDKVFRFEEEISAVNTMWNLY